jgi:MFS transporter, ACS family, solute carrier family 17 (sodium-dependent inorganic phosphate cotransporter), other
MSNTAATIPGILGVILTGYMVSATGGWAAVFFVAAGVYLFGVVTWLLMSTGKRVIE